MTIRLCPDTNNIKYIKNSIIYCVGKVYAESLSPLSEMKWQKGLIGYW